MLITALRAERLDFELERTALTHEGRKSGEDFRQIAASLALHADGGDQEQQIILSDAAMQIGDGCRDVLAERNFLSGHGEFGPDRGRAFPWRQVQWRSQTGGRSASCAR